MQRTWLWVTAEKSVWCIFVGTYPKSTPWELAADASYWRYSYYTVTQATAGAAAGSADLSTLTGAGHWGNQEGTKPLPLALSCVSVSPVPSFDKPSYAAFVKENLLKDLDPFSEQKGEFGVEENS